MNRVNCISTFYTALTCPGLFCDVKMFMFVKDQNKIQPVQLVPWKSMNQKDNNDDQNVPLRATVISTMSLIIASTIA